MIVVMGTRNPADIQRVVERIEALGFRAHLSEGVERTLVHILGDERGKYQLESLDSMPGVERVVPVLKPYKLASREHRDADTLIETKSLRIGRDRFAVMAGSGSLDCAHSACEAMRRSRAAGASAFWAGAYWSDASPYSFRSLDDSDVYLLRETADEADVTLIIEVMTPDKTEFTVEFADVLMVGSLNMQNYGLLKAVGRTRKPVVLKRAMTATLTELLMSAEYIMAEGNAQVILCDCGIRTFETETRNTLAMTATPLLKQLTHLPVVVDPSQAAGHWNLVAPLCRAAMAAGADGLLLEVCLETGKTAEDSVQSLKLQRFEALMADVASLAGAFGKETAGA